MDGSVTPALRREPLDPATTAAADGPAMLQCAAILAADAPSRAASLEAALGPLGGAAEVLRVGNPLSAKLSLHRMLIQIGAEEAFEDPDEAEATLARLLQSRGKAHGRVVLVIEQAETLHPAALLSLQSIAGAPGPVEVLFVGKPAFLTLLDRAELAPLRRALSAGTAQEGCCGFRPARHGPIPGNACTPRSNLASRSADHRGGTRRGWCGACPGCGATPRIRRNGPASA